MLPKLVLIIIVAGATACALLVNRQHRIDTAHEIAMIHQRIVQQEQTLWRLRSDIAERTRPETIRHRAEKLTIQWVAIPTAPRQHEGVETQLATADRWTDAGYHLSAN